MVAGVAVRVGIRIAGGEDAFLVNGYSFYLTLANNLLAGHGLCYEPGASCALRLPVYPVFLAGFIWSGQLYPGVVIVQAVMGAALAWMAWWIGRETFGPRVGLLAAAGTALNPYAVIHDTALQDTALLNLLMLGAIVLLLRARLAPGVAMWLGGGVALGLAVLTSGRVAVFAPLAIAWTLAAGGGSRRDRLRSAMLVALPLVILMGGWMTRNWIVVGAPVLTTEAGEGLFLGNGPLTFTHFPDRSIDLAYDEFERLAPEAQDTLQRLEGQDVARDAVLRAWALDYIAANPAQVVWGGARKLWVIASAQLSPAREPLVQWGYRLLFLSIHALALVGAWQVRSHWQAHALFALLVLSFAATTAVFWAHTSHKSYLDPVLFVYAAAGVVALRPPRPTP